MSSFFQFKDYLMLVANYKDPVPHKHLASHIIISLGGEMTWEIEDKLITCTGICINSNIMHTGKSINEGCLVFLFTEISNYSLSLDKKYLKGKDYCVLNEEIIKEVLCEYEKCKKNNNFESNKLLEKCNINNIYKKDYDERIKEVLSYISNVQTIEKTIIDDLSNKVFLSKSRLSHLFKEETGSSLHSYLAFEKLRKTHKYYLDGNTLTDSCILAGFDSSSHFSATCKRMFGISTTDVFKTIQK